MADKTQVRGTMRSLGSGIQEYTSKKGELYSYKFRTCVGRDDEDNQVWRSCTILADDPRIEGLTPAKREKTVRRLKSEWDEQQKADFETYIQSNKYLRTHRGEILTRNAITSGWRHSFDLKVNQNFYFFTGADHHRHTLQLGVDISDIHTLLNPAWGRGWSVNTNDGYGNGKPLNLTNPAAVYTTGAKPVFQFQKNGTEKLTSVYTRGGSSWEMIFSVRYIF